MEGYCRFRTCLYGVSRNCFIFTLITAHRTVSGLRRRLILFGEVKVVIVRLAVEYGAGKMQVYGLIAGDTIIVLPVVSGFNIHNFDCEYCELFL